MITEDAIKHVLEYMDKSKEVIEAQDRLLRARQQIIDAFEEQIDLLKQIIVIHEERIDLLKRKSNHD